MQAKIILDFDHNLAELWFNGELIHYGHCELFPPEPYFSDGEWKVSPYIARITKLLFFSNGIEPVSQVEFFLCDPDGNFPIEEAERCWDRKPKPTPELMYRAIKVLKEIDRDVLLFLQCRYTAQEIAEAMKGVDFDD